MKHPIVPLLFAALLATACTDTELHYVRGTLYTDSTLTTPMPGQTLDFVMEQDDTLGTIRTDNQGHFGFAFNVGIDPIARRDAKLKIEYSWLYIIHQGDTLYGDEYPCVDGDTLLLYPGCNKVRRYWK